MVVVVVSSVVGRQVGDQASSPCIVCSRLRFAKAGIADGVCGPLLFAFLPSPSCSLADSVVECAG